MRKLYSLIAAFIFTLAVSGMSAGTAFALPSPSLETWTDKSENVNRSGTPVRVLKLVRYTSRDSDGFALASGDAVVYDTNSDDGVSVRQTNTSADGTLAGIMVTAVSTADGNSVSAHEDWGRRNWGWALVHGPINANVRAGGSNAHTVGDSWVTSRDGGAITATQNFNLSHDMADAAWQTYTNLMVRQESKKGGFFLDTATASDTSVEVFVNLE